MKLSDFINGLKKLENVYGDIDVNIYNELTQRHNEIIFTDAYTDIDGSVAIEVITTG